MKPHTQEFSSYAQSVPDALDSAGARQALAGRELVIIKPNLVNSSPPPITLPARCAEALVLYVKECCNARIVIAEGCGEPGETTMEIFEALGYSRLAQRHNVELIDLNEAKLTKLAREECRIFPEMYLPDIVLEGFLISAAVLKAHSLAGVTLTMKNMMGCAPPSHYQQGGYWRKAAFHANMQRAVYELNRYRKPDLGFIDASVGMAEHHLGGPECDPPVGKLVAGLDPAMVDRTGAELLGVDPASIGHIELMSQAAPG